MQCANRTACRANSAYPTRACWQWQASILLQVGWLFTSGQALCQTTQDAQSHTHSYWRKAFCMQDTRLRQEILPSRLTKTHMKTHLPVRPHLCTEHGCNKAYFHARSLRKHLKSHASRRQQKQSQK